MTFDSTLEVLSKKCPLLLATIALAAGCSGTSSIPTGEPENRSGVVSLAISQPPPDAACLQVTVVGSSTVTQTFTLTQGMDATFTATGLPIGNDTILESAFPVACTQVTPTSVASWISDPTPVTLQSGVVAHVTVVLKHNGTAVISTQFGGDAGGTTSNCPNKALTYLGGPVISNVQVVVVNWGPNVDATVVSQIGGFYSGLVGSPYITWLSQYDTTGRNGMDGMPGSNQHIGAGTFGGVFTIAPSVTSTTVTDAQVASELAAQVASGGLPPVALDSQGIPNTAYMVQFPPGVTITVPGGFSSCAQFCAEHGVAAINGTEVPYAVIPDLSPSGPCGMGCGTDPVPFNNVTGIESGELVSMITDPQLALASAIGRPIAWIDTANSNGISDLCQAKFGGLTLGTPPKAYIVQQEWSDADLACVVTSQQSAPCSP